MNEKDIEDLRENGYQLKTENGEKSYWKITDHVWVARKIKFDFKEEK